MKLNVVTTTQDQWQDFYSLKLHLDRYDYSCIYSRGAYTALCLSVAMECTGEVYSVCS